MTSEELATEVETIIRTTRERILGPGAQQYDDGSGVQTFERLPLEDLARWLIEEADDLIVYAAMIRIRASRLVAVTEQGG